MAFARWLKKLAPIVLVLVLLVSACTAAPNKYDQVQSETTGRNAPAAVAKEAEQGSTFNQFFPDSQGEYEVIPAQEKKGFAEYKLNQGSTTIAMLSINDTTSVPAAAAKYADATETVAGYPMVNQGAMATGLLINDRYQVKVLSRSPSFTQADRVEWLQKFDLSGIAQLQGAATPVVPGPAAKAQPLTVPPGAPQAPVLVPQPAS
ncbi:MAG: hypothetical protein ICV62_04200 [Cyanobacteria bacterium Co-bin13]|nr:hypothetical protein [Cyanobacteria bacterium Co-bin13]